MYEPDEEEIFRVVSAEPVDQDFERIQGHLKEWFGDYLRMRRVDSLKAALEEINSGKYDLILTEIHFPNEDDNPRSVIREIMEQPGAADTPVVAIADSDDTALPINAFRNGMSEFFSKVNLNRPLMEYRMRNLLQREFRNKMMQKQIGDSLHRFQQAHGMSQEEISDLNQIVGMMKQELEQEYEEKMNLEAERNKIQSLFGMYVDPQIVKGIMNDDISMEQKGREQEISVLFTDIRGYTRMTEQMDPQNVISFLNEYFTSMTEVIMGYNGMVDKYIGDSIMCLFGTPVATDTHRDDALQAAMEMQGIFELWTGNWESTYGIRPAMGIGVASGKAVVGNVGSFQKISYTAVGDTINVGARLEGLSKPGEVLISQDTYTKLGEESRGKFDFEALEPIEIKGKTGTHQVYRMSQ